MNFRFFLFLLAASSGLSEVLTLTTGASFHGDLLSISPEGGILVASKRTPEPLAFKLDSFRTLKMDNPMERDPLLTELLVLTNGDVLPGNLKALDKEQIVFESLAGGTLVLSRDKLTSLRVGIKKQTIQYDGPGPLSDWSGDGSKNWSMSQDPANGLLMLEPGQIEQDLKLGSQFILKFSIKWENNPNIRIYFGALPTNEGKQDRHYIDLNQGGLQVRRENSTSPQWKTLITLNQVEAFDDRQVDVELRVNRTLGTLDLYLDGEFIRQMNDSSPPTKGDTLIIERNKSSNSAFYLTKLQVLSWDAISHSLLKEAPTNSELDSLVDTKGVRTSGKLTSFLTSDEPTLSQEEEEAEEAEASSPSPHFLLQSPFAEAPLKISLEKAKFIYFQKLIKLAPPNIFPRHEIELANNGILSATAIAINGAQITLDHPLMGKINVDRSAVKEIRYITEPRDEDE